MLSVNIFTQFNQFHSSGIECHEMQVLHCFSFNIPASAALQKNTVLYILWANSAIQCYASIILGDTNRPVSFGFLFLSSFRIYHMNLDFHEAPSP